MHDFRFALRSLLKSPAYTSIALLTLALGIGVNTSMVSLVEALLFRAAPYPHPEQLVQIVAQTRTGRQFGFSATEIGEIRGALQGVTAVATVGFSRYSWTDPGRPAERLNAVTLSREMSDVFQTQPILGRLPLPEEYEPGRNQVVLISEPMWVSRFGRSPDVIGRTLRLQDETVTIIGVMPERFEYRLFWGNVVLWRPLNFTPDQERERAYRGFLLLARLAPGARPGSVGPQLSALAASQEKAFPQEYSGLRYQALTLTESVMDSAGRAISWTLLGFSIFILLIACANLANLQLARATSSMRDYAIRAALGASRARLVRHLLAESLVVSLGGGAVGVLVALWINDVLERNILIGGVPGFALPLDGPVLLLTLGVSVATGLIFGIVPALVAARVDVNAILKSGARGSTSGRGHHRTRSALIVGEVTMAVVLLGGAAIMNRGFSRMLQREVGWETGKLAVAALPIQESRYPTPEGRVVFFRKLEERLGQLPGVEHAALATAVPLFDYSTNRPVFLDAPGASGKGENPVASHVMVTADFFATLGIPLLDGRVFPADLREDGPRYILVNAALARRFWSGESAIGKRLGSSENNRVQWSEVIGVVGDVEAAASLSNASTPLVVYRPLVHEPWSYVNLVLRGAHPEALLEPMRKVVADLDFNLALDQVGTIRQRTDTVMRNILIVARMTLAFAGLGLALAAVGVYGVISNLVAQRTAEFGIRLALGARPADVFADVLKRGLSLALIGVVLGEVGAYGLSRLLSSTMPRLAAPDPLGLAGVCVVLLVSAFLACWVPARRATRVEPMAALRSE